MRFDFSKIPGTKAQPTDPDWSNPVSFFYKLNHPEIKDLFPVQRDALKGWFESLKNGENDKMVSLNTGGGKTLIGLMIAESMRRGSEGKIIYVCPNNFLGKQTVDEAKKYGLEVSSYLKLSSDRPTWTNENAFLQNQSLCVTTYSALLNPRSIFKAHEIKGVVFDDAHLSLDLLDDQFSIKTTDLSLIKSVASIFATSDHIKEKISSILEGDPLSVVMIPPLEWHNQAATIKDLLSANDEIKNGLQWINIRERLDRTFCFISAKSMEIGFLYPDVKNHYVFQDPVNRVYLSATLPNLDDLTRIFRVTPSRIQIDNPDYRPERLFIFSKKLNIENADQMIRQNLLTLSPKTLVLAPSNNSLIPYKDIGAITATHSPEIPEKIERFKSSDVGILALANRYDGIDMPGGTCHSLLVDGLPYTGNLKNRFFSENFHNHKNSFLRSLIASKLVQAFGRTIRANNDYSVIFLLNDKLNSWVINKDNKKFFQDDLYQDIEIGINTSATISSLDELTSLVGEILGQTKAWKEFFEDRKNETVQPHEAPINDEEVDIKLAQQERKIHDLFMEGKYAECLEEILASQENLFRYSKPILGLYISIATICCSKISDVRLIELSARAYGLSPLFGSPVKSNGINRTLQAQRIINYEKALPVFDWTIKGTPFDENLRKLGEVLGFNSFRPENESAGTLDVCWEDEENQIVIGFENKIDKSNDILSKHEIDQCSGHSNWLQENYPKHKKLLFAVGEIKGYHNLASPGTLLHLPVSIIEKVARAIPQVYAKRSTPEQIDPSLITGNLGIDDLFPENPVSELEKFTF
jgi:hypothetical protein